MTTTAISPPRRLGRHAVALAAVVAVISGTFMLFSGVAEAKILPYELDVRPHRSEVGQPIAIGVTLDPQNALGDSFAWEIAVFRASAMTEQGWPQNGARPVKKVTMRLVSAADRTYEGSFKATKSGRYVVVGMTGRPDRGTEPRCLGPGSGTALQCWPRPVPVTVRDT